MEEIPWRFRYSSIFSSSIESTGMLLHSFWNSETANPGFISQWANPGRRPHRKGRRETWFQTLQHSGTSVCHRQQALTQHSLHLLQMLMQCQNHPKPEKMKLQPTKQQQNTLELNYTRASGAPGGNLCFLCLFATGVSFCLQSLELWTTWMNFTDPDEGQSLTINGNFIYTSSAATDLGELSSHCLIYWRFKTFTSVALIITAIWSIPCSTDNKVLKFLWC